MRAYSPVLFSILISIFVVSCDFLTDPAVPLPVASVSVEPKNAVVPVGTSTQFSAIARDSLGQILSGRSTTWTSSDDSLALVGTVGAVTGVAPGFVKVIATVEGKRDTAKITVASVVAVVLTPATIALQTGATQQFTASGQLSDSSTAPVNVTYSATGGTITSSGFYTAGSVAGGYRVIATQTKGALADTSMVAIALPSPTPPALVAVVLTPPSVTLQSGATQQFAASGQMSDGSTTTVNVTYSATGGTITSSGFYTAGSVAGSYRVIATQTGGTLADTSTVTVITPPAGCTGVPVLPGTNIQSAVNANPAGTVFCIASGTHVRQRVIPKPGNQFIGAQGAIMDGENVTSYAFDAGTSNWPGNVVIRGLKVTRYNPPFQMGAIKAGDQTVFPGGGANWVVEDNEITENLTGGLRISDGMQVRRNYVHHNHAIGIVGIGDNVLVENNEISFNNYLREFDTSGENGGTKFVLTNNLIVRNNYVHDNLGPGLWTDISNRNALIEGNVSDDNTGPGIFHEISFAAIIRNNICRRNGYQYLGWIWGGGIQISTSRDVQIYGNTLEDNKYGVSIVQQDRSADEVRDNADYYTANIRVFDNVIIQKTLLAEDGFPAGAQYDYPVGGGPAFYAGIKFTNNRYTVKTERQFWSWDASDTRTWAEWQAYGNDVTGSLTTIP